MDDERRKTAVRTIQVLVDYGIGVGVIAAMLKVSRQQVYRWLSGGWLPREKMCEPIEELLKRAGRVKRDWEAVVRTWDRHALEAVQITLYKRVPRKILNCDATDEEKVCELTSFTFAEWTEKGRK